MPITRSFSPYPNLSRNCGLSAIPPVLHNEAIFKAVAPSKRFCIAHDVAAISSSAGIFGRLPRFITATIMCDALSPWRSNFSNLAFSNLSAGVNCLYRPACCSQNADGFSDRIDSKKSSLGFYLTDDIYFGEHGRSLRLDGLDPGFNANARKRAIVLHAAEYVCENVIERKGRLGRSFGCPAVSPEVIDQVLDAIKDKSVLFIHGQNKRYNSRYLDEEVAGAYLATGLGGNITASL